MIVAPAIPTLVAASVIVPDKVSAASAATSKAKAPRAPPQVALISTEPRFFAVTVPSALTLATAVFDERHVASVVTVVLLPSGWTAMAAKGDDSPITGGVPATINDLTLLESGSDSRWHPPEAAAPARNNIVSRSNWWRTSAHEDDVVDAHRVNGPAASRARIRQPNQQRVDRRLRRLNVPDRDKAAERAADAVWQDECRCAVGNPGDRVDAGAQAGRQVHRLESKFRGARGGNGEFSGRCHTDRDDELHVRSRASAAGRDGPDRRRGGHTEPARAPG